MDSSFPFLTTLITLEIYLVVVDGYTDRRSTSAISNAVVQTVLFSTRTRSTFSTPIDLEITARPLAAPLEPL